jgi:hypothetical protein
LPFPDMLNLRRAQTGVSHRPCTSAPAEHNELSLAPKISLLVLNVLMIMIEHLLISICLTMDINSKARISVTNYNILLSFLRSDNSVGIVTVLWTGRLKNHGSFLGWLREFSSLQRPHRPWGPPGQFCSAYRRLFPQR